MQSFPSLMEDLNGLKTRVRAECERNPRLMTSRLAEDLGVAEADVLRCLPDNRAVELDARRWEELIRRFEDLGKVHVVVSNSTTTVEVFGTFGKFSTWGNYFNVQTKSIDMHIRYPRLHSIFAVEKPSHMDGVNTLSIQFFDEEGRSAFKVFLTFGGTPPAPERVADFQLLRDAFRLTTTG